MLNALTEVAMKRFALVLVIMFFARTTMLAQTSDCIDPCYQTAPTVTGGTGLFQTFTTRTLPRGQYSFGVFWHNYDRDPGDLDINRVPVNFTLGLTQRLEIFANINAFQQVTTRQPFLLSGSSFNRFRLTFGGRGADPFVAFGQPIRRGGGAAFFPRSGNLTGSILPPVGAVGTPITGVRSPFNRAGYYNEFPFFPFADAAGPRMSSNGLGDASAGLKINLLNPNRRFSLAALGLIKIPTARHYDALADGRGAGTVDGGPMLIMSQNFLRQRIRFHQNFGYMLTGSMRRHDVTLLDRRDELLLNAGLEIAPWTPLVYIVEWNNTVYVGGGTPNLNPVNPMDLRIGARLFLWHGRVHLGGAWQGFLTNADDRTVVISPTFTPINLRADDANGFVFHIGYGRRPPRAEPPPPNRAPTLNLEVEKLEVTDGESVQLYARATDPDNDVLIYNWTTTAGQIIGSGANVSLDTTGVNPTVGAPAREVKVSVTVDDGRGCSDSASQTIKVNSPQPPPNLNPTVAFAPESCTVIGQPQIQGQVTDGERIRLVARASDPNNDPLTYEWQTSAGQIIGSGPVVTLDTTNVTAGPGAPPVDVVIQVRVSDGRGGSAAASTTCRVSSVPRPLPIQLDDLRFNFNSARVDNTHKAILDDVALRLQQDPTTILVLDGHQDKAERRNVSRQRAENVKRYLETEKGIDPNRIIVRDFGAGRPDPSGDPKRNRRVQMWIVPRGAEMPQ